MNDAQHRQARWCHSGSKTSGDCRHQLVDGKLSPLIEKIRLAVIAEDLGLTTRKSFP